MPSTRTAARARCSAPFLPPSCRWMTWARRRSSATCACCRAGLVLVTGPTGSGKSTTLAGMVDHCNDNPARPHPHHRGSHRIRARVQALPHQPARSTPRHAGFRRGAAFGAARGSGHRAGGRNARSRDHPPRAQRRGNRPPGVRHAAHQFGGQDHRSCGGCLPRGGKGNGPLHAFGIAARGDLADAAQEERRRPRGRARDHDRHAGHP